MHTAFALYHLYESGRVRHALKTLALETRTLLGALLSPNQVIADVKAMRAMQLEADRIEATQPARAAVLRHRAACMGR
ncbi:hypothetical protein [Ideonella sp.]|uniref:hypothetical protein n=1 Tax=Ideonella sp. TaxID=1929293 RepID=UPI002B46A002|nr:hypothetical protein [Ideonella sp.]HJV71456.1 hypothetical protein [Ideonella sp.]